jgi:predicted RNase H-like HicB family nuclease
MMPTAYATIEVQEQMEHVMKYRILIEQDEDGIFVSMCPALPGCVSQGVTRDEAVANMKDAIGGYLESLRMEGEPIPPPIAEEVVDV